MWQETTFCSFEQIFLQVTGGGGTRRSVVTLSRLSDRQTVGGRFVDGKLYANGPVQKGSKLWEWQQSSQAIVPFLEGPIFGRWKLKQYLLEKS